MTLRRSGEHPERRVRATLDERGRPITVGLGVLMATWGGDARSVADRRAVDDLLSGVGVRATPTLADIDDPAATIRLELGGSRVPSSQPEAEAEARPEPETALLAPPSQLAACLFAGGLVVLGGLSTRWYTGERASETADGLDTGWDWLTRLDVVLLVLAVASLIAAAAVVLKLGLGTFVPRVLLGAGLLCLFLVAFRIVSPPGDAIPGTVLEVSLGPGPFVTGAGLLAILLGARLAMPVAGGGPARR